MLLILRLVMERLADKGAKVKASVLAIEEELEKRRSIKEETKEESTAKGKIVFQLESALEKASITPTASKIATSPAQTPTVTMLDSDDSEPEEEEVNKDEIVKKVFSNLKARYDEALLPLPSLYKVKSLTMKESQNLDIGRLYRLQVKIRHIHIFKSVQCPI
jgi:hypothetical protein